MLPIRLTVAGREVASVEGVDRGYSNIVAVKLIDAAADLAKIKAPTMMSYTDAKTNQTCYIAPGTVVSIRSGQPNYGIHCYIVTNQGVHLGCAETVAEMKCRHFYSS